MLPDEKPVYRLKRHGAEYLSDTELLAVVLGTERLQPVRDLLRDGLMNLEKNDKAPPKVKAALELHRRLAGHYDPQEPVRDPTVLANGLIARYAHLEQEQVGAIYLDSRNVVIKEKVVFIGTVSSAFVSTREILKHALLLNACGFILFHNHPSGNPAPSSEDIIFTRKVRDAARLLDILVLDHLIVARQGFVSFEQRGFM